MHFMWQKPFLKLKNAALILMFHETDELNKYAQMQLLVIGLLDHFIIRSLKPVGYFSW